MRYVFGPLTRKSTPQRRFAPSAALYRRIASAIDSASSCGTRPVFASQSAARRESLTSFSVSADVHDGTVATPSTASKRASTASTIATLQGGGVAASSCSRESENDIVVPPTAETVDRRTSGHPP